MAITRRLAALESLVTWTVNCPWGQRWLQAYSSSLRWLPVAAPVVLPPPLFAPDVAEEPLCAGAEDAAPFEPVAPDEGAESEAGAADEGALSEALAGPDAAGVEEDWQALSARAPHKARAADDSVTFRDMIVCFLERERRDSAECLSGGGR